MSYRPECLALLGYLLISPSAVIAQYLAPIRSNVNNVPEATYKQKKRVLHRSPRRSPADGFHLNARS